MLHLTKENGHIGAIVPISYISTKRMNPIRQLLKQIPLMNFVRVS